MGKEIGVGEWLQVDSGRVALFEHAAGGQPDGLIPPLLLLSLLPRLLSGIELPVATPVATVNYGLDKVERGIPVTIGERVRARTTVTGVERIGDAVQVRRRATIENEAGSVALTAETVTRLVY